MRVAIFLDSFPTYSETFIYNQIYYLADNHVEFKIFSIKKGNSIIHPKILEYGLIDNVIFLRHGFSFLLLKNFIFYFLASISIFKFSSFRKSLFYILNLDIFSKLDRYEVTHSHFGHVGDLICELIKLGFLKRTKVVNSFHGFDLLPSKKEYYKNKYKSLLNFASIITFNSHYTFSIFQEISDFRKESIEIIPESLDTNYFENEAFQSSCVIRLIFIGRLISWKAPLLSLEIFKRLKCSGQNVHLTIIGDGEEMSNCKKFIKENDLNECVELMGALDQDAIISKLQESNIFLMPGITDPQTGRAENQGLVIQEAQAMNLPVIVSTAGGMKYGLKHDETGYVVKEGDIDGFVEKISFLIENPDIRKEMGRSGREFVVKNFDFKVLGLRILNVYRKLL